MTVKQDSVPTWTVYRVASLYNGGNGQCLERLGTVDAADYSEAMEKAHEAFRMEANPALPQGGLTVIAQRA